ncbi:CPBP family intramembrane metalloprotease [Clostridium senegalense]|uniref:CPBP family intramembrane glutamic endopeptidase n=1 Tax=Clostridium senegalense TaxID=1465809 RepID=UPI001C100210|nr:type II CAAX endopeptidase family protein [Clostridium senegalense]MBU5227010.1 CPBP family intramembrane metalloprotease [Clostridium senegalense]
MNNYLSNAKKEVSMALIINFGITALMGIILVVAYKKIPTTSTSSTSDFAVVQMLYPAFATIITIKYFNKEKLSKPINIFLNIFIATTIISICALFICTFFFSNNPKVLSFIINGIIGIFSVASTIVIFSNKNKDFESLNLEIGKNFKKIVIVLLIFVGLFIVSVCVGFIVEPDDSFKISNLINTLVSLPVSLFFSVVFSFIMFFGEEFGWRGYLQPRLQSIFGKKLGVLILGPIWGIWHLPLCFTLYSPKTPIYCVIWYIISCTCLSIFLGYAYMKTENLWTPILIHLINNKFAGMFSGGNYEATFELETLLVGIAINVIIFVPFIFTKEYKKSIGEQAQI